MRRVRLRACEATDSGNNVRRKTGTNMNNNDCGCVCCLQILRRHLVKMPSATFESRRLCLVKLCCDATVVKQGVADCLKLPLSVNPLLQRPGTGLAAAPRVPQDARGSSPLLPPPVWGGVGGCGPRPDLVAPSRPFTPFRPTPGRTPRTGRPGWTGASPWPAGTLPGPCAC